MSKARDRRIIAAWEGFALWCVSDPSLRRALLRDAKRSRISRDAIDFIYEMSIIPMSRPACRRRRKRIRQHRDRRLHLVRLASDEIPF